METGIGAVRGCSAVGAKWLRVVLEAGEGREFQEAEKVGEKGPERSPEKSTEKSTDKSTDKSTGLKTRRYESKVTVPNREDNG